MMLSSGLFYSKLSYCLPLFINTWGLDTYRDSNIRSISITKDDIRQLQVLQNNLCRLILGEQGIYYKQNLPTQELLDRCGELSVHQIGAQRTIMMVKKILRSEKPGYLSSKLVLRQTEEPGAVSNLSPVHASLNITREGFLYRGIKLFNLLPEALKAENTLSIFKEGLKSWIKENISIKP